MVEGFPAVIKPAESNSVSCESSPGSVSVADSASSSFHRALIRGSGKAKSSSKRPAAIGQQPSPAPHEDQMRDFYGPAVEAVLVVLVLFVLFMAFGQAVLSSTAWQEH